MTGKIVYRSSKGIKFRKIILWLTFILLLGLIILALFNLIIRLDNSPDWSFFLIIGGLILLNGLLITLIFPDTYTVALNETGIEIKSGKKVEQIPFKNIKNVAPSISFIDSLFRYNIFYKIDFNDHTFFGQTVYFRERTKFFAENSSSLAVQLKKKIVQKKAHAKNPQMQ